MLRAVRATNALCLLALGLAPAAMTGCASNPFSADNQFKELQQRQTAALERYDDMQKRLSTLDTDHQQLESLLAQEKQRAKLAGEEASALREQLSSITDQLTSLKQQKDQGDRQAEALTASLRKRIGARVTANSSLRDQLDDFHIDGVEIRPEGDVIRVELPGAMLFEPGNARMLSTASGQLDLVAEELVKAFPNQRIGVEGHTDSDPIAGGSWTSNHQLSLARALAVYDYLVRRTALKAEQLVVVGHGSNNPVVSNGSSAGKQRNRRVELVVYPETISSK